MMLLFISCDLARRKQLLYLKRFFPKYVDSKTMENVSKLDKTNLVVKRILLRQRFHGVSQGIMEILVYVSKSRKSEQAIIEVS